MPLCYTLDRQATSNTGRLTPLQMTYYCVTSLVIYLFAAMDECRVVATAMAWKSSCFNYQRWIDQWMLTVLECIAFPSTPTHLDINYLSINQPCLKTGKLVLLLLVLPVHLGSVCQRRLARSMGSLFLITHLSIYQCLSINEWMD